MRILLGIVAGMVLAVQAAAPAMGQEEEAKKPAKIKVEPEALELAVGETGQLNVSVLDENDQPVDVEVGYFPVPQRSRVLADENAPFVFPARAFRAVGVDQSGKVTAQAPGKFTIRVMVPATEDTKPLRTNVTVNVPFPALERIEFTEGPKKLYASTSVGYEARAVDASGAARPEVKLTLSSSDEQVAAVDEFGNVTAKRPGTFSIVAEGGGIRAEQACEVVANPVERLELTVDRKEARTGDVLHFEATARDNLGRVVPDAPLYYSVFAQPYDNLGPPATGQVEQDGRFVAELPGLYTVVVTSGNHSARLTVRIGRRDVQQKIELVGHAPVREVHTSDLWVWQGVDGRDYAVTGTWGANGEAYFWDVTDPKNMKKIDSVKVDARTVNDVKVSADGRICIISREGASNRRNGIVILDVTNPSDVKHLSTFDDGLTGGVHNLFIYGKHAYVVNNGRRYDVIDVEDPYMPHRVGRFELDTPSHAIHDVWIEEGIAYSSNWHDGLQLVDIGNGIAGGTPQNPVKFDSYAYPTGWNHAAFPYYSRSTGRFYVIAGDEAFPYGFDTEKPTIAAGWLHFIDFTTPSKPKEVARFEVPGAGTHNLWVEGDTLYVAYYNAGLRVVDISGELMGDLYRQGREIAWYLPQDPKGYIPNAAMTWGPQPHKGNIFLSDHNSGLWAVRLVPKEKDED